MKLIRVVPYGLGPIGCATVRALLEKPGISIVGAVDIDPEKVGKDLGDVAGLGNRVGVLVSKDAAAVFKKARPNVVTHTTSSFFKSAYDQLALAASQGINVVSSTEELLYPRLRNPDLARKLDRLARKNGATLLGTGVNPGFVMDTLALVLTGVVKRVERIRIERRVDAATRRQPLQRKVGAGMKPEEFVKLAKQGKIGHVGLLESMYLVAAGLGWELDKHIERIEPVIATTRQTTEYFTVEAEEVAGIKHTASGFCGKRLVIDLDLRMYIGAQDPCDRVEIEGNPNLTLAIPGGVPGDIATVASLVNAIPHVLESEPGLKTVLDLPVPRAFRAV